METSPTKMETDSSEKKSPSSKETSDGKPPGPKGFLATRKKKSDLEKKYPATPESILLRRKKREQEREKKIQRKFRDLALKKLKREVYFRRAESYVKEYRQQLNEEMRMRKVAQSQNSFYVPSQPKLAFVMRIKGICRVPPKPRKILQLFRLLQINNAVFIKLNKATLMMLRLAEPYVAWGYPNLKSVRELIYKCGHLKVKGQRKAIVDNEMIEKKLGKKSNIICIEDLVHEIYTVGPHFTEAANALWPFKLTNPKGGWKRKSTHYVDGGDFGNREDKINLLIKRIL